MPSPLQRVRRPVIGSKTAGHIDFVFPRRRLTHLYRKPRALKESVISAMADEVDAMGKMVVWSSDEADKPDIREWRVACEVNGVAEGEPSQFAPTRPVEVMDFVGIRIAHLKRKVGKKIVVRLEVGGGWGIFLRPPQRRAGKRVLLKCLRSLGLRKAKHATPLRLGGGENPPVFDFVTLAALVLPRDSAICRSIAGFSPG